MFIKEQQVPSLKTRYDRSFIMLLASSPSLNESKAEYIRLLLLKFLWRKLLKIPIIESFLASMPKWFHSWTWCWRKVSMFVSILPKMFSLFFPTFSFFSGYYIKTHKSKPIQNTTVKKIEKEKRKYLLSTEGIYCYV